MGRLRRGGHRAGPEPPREQTAARYGPTGRCGNEFGTAGATAAKIGREIEAHRWAMLQDSERVAEVRRELRGKRLTCGCGASRCHAKSYAEVANCDDRHLDELVASVACRG